VQQLCEKQYLHGSVTWPVRKENKQAEMRVVRWMCGIKVTERFPRKKLREKD